MAAMIAISALAALQARGQGATAAVPDPATLPRVHVIATGGTISNLGSDARRTGNELVDGIPQIARVARVSVEQFSNVASGAVTLQQWRDLATRIATLSRATDAPAGFVITHGTDTMEETAYFLELTAPRCLPIVVTGAMRRANDVGADGPANLLNAVRLAASPAARRRGAMVLMNDEIFRARDVTKSNTSRMNAFTAPDAGALGIADPDTIVFWRSPADGECATPLFDVTTLGAFPRVDVIYAHIGADSVLVDALVAAGAQGLVVAGVGRGGTPPAMGRALRRAADRGIIVAMSNRTGSGRVGDGLPPDSLAMLPAGRGASVGSGELNPQKARILLMLALAARFDAAGIAQLFRMR